LLTLAAAIVLPLVLLAAIASAFGLNDQRRQIEADALARANSATARVDGELMAEKSALEVLAVSRAMRNHDWGAVRSQIERVGERRPRWRNVILTDAAARREIFQTVAHLGETRPARTDALDYIDGAGKGFQVGGMAGKPPSLVLHSPVFENAALAFVLTLELDPSDFQAILMSAQPEGGVSAVVDRNGRFIARSLDPKGKVGELATPYVREAINKGRSGLYEGKTWEGLENYTAFETSSFSGVSTHVAISANQLNTPRLRFILLIAFAGFVALALAGAIAAYGLRQLALRRREEEGRGRAQKLEAIGQLAGGVAHDFNNLLAVIMGSLDRLSRSVEGENVRTVANALAAAQRGKKLVQQLLTFTRPHGPDIGRVDLNQVVDGVRDLIAESVGPLVTVAVDIAPDARLVKSNAGELELALLNLAVNARDAMPKGGEIRIAAARAGDMVEISVADQGAGMSAKVAAQAFEPFYTTKPPGKGTGLGLAQVKKLADHSHGAAEIRSIEGQGTAVILWLPAA